MKYDYSYFKKQHDSHLAVVTDPTVTWKNKEFSYWKLFTSSIALFASDSIVKDYYWRLAWDNSPHGICEFYTSIFRSPFNPEFLQNAPQSYYYLHHEKPYFDCICDTLFASYDSSLISVMQQLIVLDGGKSKRVLDDEQRDKDNKNQATLDSIIMSIGKYPGRSIVGASYEEIGWMILQHGSTDYQMKYLPLVEAAVIEKDLSPVYLAYLQDRIRLGQRSPQIYGTQFEVLDGIKKLYPLESEHAVDSLRKSVGLIPLEVYLSRENIKK
jgi:hypothetical protein